MKNTDSEEALFVTCASCTLVAAGAAFAVLLHHLIALVVPLLHATVHTQRLWITRIILIAGTLLPVSLFAEPAASTLAVVVAHADDETPIGPILSRYARDGVVVHVIIATDGMQGGARSGLHGEALVETRIVEARCSADALGVRPPVFLGFPDGKLGDYVGDRSRLYHLTERIAAELERIHPDAVITWGPEGGWGHPDHRLVGSIVTQLVRAGAPGMPDRLFYITFPVEAMRVMSPQHGKLPLLVPASKYVTVHVPFAGQDLEAAQRAMRCHRSQFTDEVVARVSPVAMRAWNGRIPLVPAFPGTGGSEVFSPGRE